MGSSPALFLWESYLKCLVAGVFVSNCCCNKLTQWLTTLGVYVIVLGVRSPKSVSLGWYQGVSTSVLLLEAPEENVFFPCLFQLLETVCIPWLVAATFYLQSEWHSIFSLFWPLLCPFFWLCLPLIRTFMTVTKLGPPQRSRVISPSRNP